MTGTICCSLLFLVASTTMLPAATLIVTNYAAITNGAADDTAAIQRAINASASGDTIYFSPGEYPLTNTIILKPNRIYSGQGALEMSLDKRGSTKCFNQLMIGL